MLSPDVTSKREAGPSISAQLDLDRGENGVTKRRGDNEWAWRPAGIMTIADISYRRWKANKGVPMPI